MTIATSDRDDTQALIRVHLRALEAFLRLKGTMPARQIQAVLLVAEHEGLSVSDYASKAGVSPTTMSRNLLDVGERDRHYAEGLGLIEGRDNLMNRREKVYHLTPKGRGLLASLTKRVK
jgi:DNA-binding MarR family transcriptional regulator